MVHSGVLHGLGSAPLRLARLVPTPVAEQQGHARLAGSEQRCLVLFHRGTVLLFFLFLEEFIYIYYMKGGSFSSERCACFFASSSWVVPTGISKEMRLGGPSRDE